MIYITGDRHGDFSDIFLFCKKNNTTINDILIILGDAGINYFVSDLDYQLKEELLKIPITLLCIHGNHEERPKNIKSYLTKDFYNGVVFYELEYPNILFAKDGEIYNFNNQKYLVIGGAYSVDKHYRLEHGLKWYESEQPTEDIKNEVVNVLKDNNYHVDIVLSHTCPYKYIPREMFLPGIDQSTVDYSTEEFLDRIEGKTNYQKWYCGHYHTNKTIDKMVFLFNDIKKLQ